VIFCLRGIWYLWGTWLRGTRPFARFCGRGGDAEGDDASAAKGVLRRVFFLWWRLAAAGQCSAGQMQVYVGRY